MSTTVPLKVLEQYDNNVSQFQKYVDIKLPLRKNMDRDQAQRNIGRNLRSILFDTQHQMLKTGCIAQKDSNSEDIENCIKMLTLQIVRELLEGTVCLN